MAPQAMLAWQTGSREKSLEGLGVDRTLAHTAKMEKSPQIIPLPPTRFRER